MKAKLPGVEFKQNFGFKGFVYGLLIFSIILGFSGGVSAGCAYPPGGPYTGHYVCGQTISQSCEMNESLTSTGTCFTIGVGGITIAGNGHSITGNTAGYGIYAYGRNSATIKNMRIYNFSYGIYSYGLSNNLTNNTANDNIHGIYLDSSSSNTLTNNTANDNSGIGIYLKYSDSNTVTNNTANDNEDGIYLWDSDDNTLTYNTANNNTVVGIHVRYSSNNTLTYNTANNNSNYGIYLLDSDNNIMTYNTANNNSNYGIYLYLYSNNNTLTYNTANSNNYGIYLLNSDNNIMTYNTANSNAWYGIWLSSSSNNTLTYNTANNNAYGIYLSYNSDFNDLLNNSITDNTNTGVYFYSLANNNNLTSNLICSNGLDVNDSDTNSGDENTCNTTQNWNDTTGGYPCTYSCNMNINNPQFNLIDPPLGSPVCVGTTTNITANITINATDPNDPLLGNVSVCVNVTCAGGYNVSEKQYVNFTGVLQANVTFNVTPPAVGQCNVTTCVDCDGVIPEADENDNCGNATFDVVDCSAQPVPAFTPIGILILIASTVLLLAISTGRK